MLRIPKNKIKLRTRSSAVDEERPFVEARVNGGMVTVIDSTDIKDNQFQIVENAVIRYDKTRRRVGSSPMAAVKPDALKVLALVSFKRFDNNVYLVRFTPGSVHLLGASTWTPVIGTLGGGVNDRFNIVMIDDRMFFANNGVNNIQELNVTGLTFDDAGNAPKYKYLTGFNNRLVGANLVGTTESPVEVGWSGDYNFGEWQPGVDFSAGWNTLVESPSDYADFITGIFGFSDMMLILRERSLWGATKQPIAMDPFNFFVIAPSIGCDAPNTAVQIPNGICWYDSRTANVYYHTVGANPIPIADPIINVLQPQVEYAEDMFASYNSLESEYTLCIPSRTSALVRVWTYNFKMQTWSYNTMLNVSMISNIDFAASSLVIEDLVGMIEDLEGNIEDLVSERRIVSKFFGEVDGDILEEDGTSMTDNGDVFETFLVSKNFNFPRDDFYVTKVRIEYQPITTGSFSLEYSKDNGATWMPYKTVTLVAGDIGLRKLETFHKHLKCRQFCWRLRSTEGVFDILQYEVLTVGGPPSRE